MFLHFGVGSDISTNFFQFLTFWEIEISSKKLYNIDYCSYGLRRSLIILKSRLQIPALDKRCMINHVYLIKDFTVWKDRRSTKKCRECLIFYKKIRHSWCLEYLHPTPEDRGSNTVIVHFKNCKFLMLTVENTKWRKWKGNDSYLL